jgi:tetratricopeptide (TPR) repeat protein
MSRLSWLSWSLLLAACGSGAAPSDGRLAAVLAPALVPATGDEDVDLRIRAAQEAVRARTDLPALERLANALLAKARWSGDAGYYKLAERCADAVAITAPGDASALLLRGHVLHALHRFADAETLARQAVAARGSFLDQGLLGDVLLDQGRLQDALDCYNRMLALRPCLQGFARAAQVRWLRGDLAGAKELLELAAGSGSRRDPEPLAWVRVRLGAIALQANDLTEAAAQADTALELVRDYPAALLLRGRAALARGDAAAACDALAQASARCPQPEYLWAAAEALRAAGRPDDAAVVEAQLLATGAAEDPRTFAQFLLSRGESPAQALALLQQELRQRQDVFTHGAHALALLRTGDVAGARAAATAALAEGTREPRLLLQAGAVLLAAGERARAADVLAGAASQQQALLPGERRELAALRATL